MTKTPTGKGFFIWQMGNTMGGVPELIVAEAKKAGLAWLTVKVHDGPSPVNGDPGKLALACVDAGIALYGWGYCYGRSIDAEAAIAASRCNALGLAGYFIDAEGEYKLVSPQGATEFVTKLRAHLSTPVVGLCSFRYPQSHPEMPWKALLAGCDFHAPQVYPLGATSPTAFGLQLTRSLAQLKALADLPFIPIGPACASPYSLDGKTFIPWEPTVAQLDDFDATAHSLNLPGVGWWSWEAAKPRAEWWAAITAHRWPIPGDAPADGQRSGGNPIATHLRAMADDLADTGTVGAYAPASR